MRNLVLVCSLLLVFGCGDDSDPSQMNVGGVAGSGGAAGQGGGEAGSAGEGGGEAGGAGQGGEAGGAGQGGEAGGAGQGGEAGSAGQGGDPFGICPDEISFVGQVTGAGAGLPDGGTAVFEPWDASYEAGVAQVLENLPAEPVLDDESTEDIREDYIGFQLENPISVVGATVIATSFGDRANNNFWIADAAGAVEVRLDWTNPDALPPFAIHVGQRLSFTVTHVNTYFDKAQIQGITDVTIATDEEGAPITNAAVYVWTPDRPLTLDDTHRLVRITSTLAVQAAVWS